MTTPPETGKSGFVLDLGESAAELQAAVAARLGDGRPAASIAIDPATVEKDLSRLVLSLIEFLRQLMESQAIRRMEAGSLSPEEEEAVGLALMRARERIVELARQFGLTPADLKLDLGPLGRLT
jgi:hypothetical protein